ncbi:hypothetical protein I302_107744 [Kwoniella bestiolae CBS 10118]|uniref:Gfo/Idh/MocA-like oxidoreductase N-terminal domain-containing protein n=1 Tax=Kwoniella bestiolae CBS 10118 TaxID=1296100 RepID=A0A1B9FXP1_9TREE|nr:hypothetical protein I302_06517 [Kwoniella bestiolae CBS 10118]OCF23534.1 hypothetical protein I302_06517 [Kwoniella bestiolae CBS 10118]
MPAPTPNIAILGSGTFAKASYLPALLSLHPTTLNFHSIWSRSPESAQSLLSVAQESSSISPELKSGDEGLESILANPEIDGVLIVLPITSQPDLVIRCLKAGKHVMSEKPLAKVVDDARVLIQRYEREYKTKGLIWRVAENYSHEPILREAGELISNTPELGPILFWNLNMQGYIEDGSKYQKTTWRTIPDYQGGFLLDGGVHWTALLRVVLPTSARPSSLISFSSLHRTHLLPHDTLQAISLPSKSSTTESHGPKTKLTTAVNDETKVPGGIGKSSPTGQILISFAGSNIPQDKALPNGVRITFLNGVMDVTAGFNEESGDRTFKIEVVPGEGTGVKSYKTEGKMDGVKVEIDHFAKAIKELKGGNKLDEDSEGNYAKPRDALWDLAVLEGMLKSHGKEVSVDEMVGK